MEFKWNDNRTKKPKTGGEYLVVWNLGDNDYPVSSCMDWDGVDNVWRDPKSDDRIRTDDEILFWANMPNPPKGISRKVWFNSNL